MDAQLLQQLVTAAPAAALALVFLWMFMTGRVHSDAEFQRALADRDMERAARLQTQAAYELATARGDAGVRAAEIIAATLEGARHATQPAPPNQPQPPPP